MWTYVISPLRRQHPTNVLPGLAIEVVVRDHLSVSTRARLVSGKLAAAHWRLKPRLQRGHKRLAAAHRGVGFLRSSDRACAWGRPPSPHVTTGSPRDHERVVGRSLPLRSGEGPVPPGRAPACPRWTFGDLPRQDSDWTSRRSTSWRPSVSLASRCASETARARRCSSRCRYAGRPVTWSYHRPSHTASRITRWKQWSARSVHCSASARAGMTFRVRESQRSRSSSTHTSRLFHVFPPRAHAVATGRVDQRPDGVTNERVHTLRPLRTATRR